MSWDLETLAVWVFHFFRKNRRDLPAFPTVASRLIDVLEHPGVQVGQVQEIIAQDQATAAKVISVANSPLYAGVTEIDNLRQAIVRLGFRETANIAVAAAYRSLFDMETRLEYEFYPEVWTSIWHYSLLCAYGGKLLAKELRMGNPDRIFLAGMFHDMGKLLVMKAVAQGCMRGEIPAGVPPELLARLLQEVHVDLSAEFLVVWNMPDYVIDIAQDHHEPAPAFSPETLDLHLVRLAGGLGNKIGVAPFSEGTMGIEGNQSAATLGIDAERVDYLELQFRSLFEQLEAIV